uniref:Uncharacterized protein n=1 Tax=Hyaloperonospora arabidopsidis (strain Emoy2) TaxID=559515 RepID=M4BAM9_HYAAE
MYITAISHSSVTSLYVVMVSTCQHFSAHLRSVESLPPRAKRRLTSNTSQGKVSKLPMAPPEKRGKAASARNTSFNIQDKLEFGFEVVGKGTRTDKIDLIACVFYLKYGIEEKVAE